MNMNNRNVDVLVVGGGINGAGIARDLAGRGLSVLLCEQHDLASHTSSGSTKLIHGGLRYLEYHEFNLVRKALIEREVLLRSAPHIMWPLRFVMPHDPGMRPAWLIRLGLFLYDHLARRELLPGSAGINLRNHPAGTPLHDTYRKGFVYSDGWVDDARLVVLNALDAQERGAEILTRTRCTRLQPGSEGGWMATLEPEGGAAITVASRAVVNAAGPWAERLLRDTASLSPKRSLKLVRGSHVVVPKMFDHPMAYIFQNPDRRIMFAIPYEQDFTLLGTTDVVHDADPGQVSASGDEVDYICAQASRYFRQPVNRDSVVWHYSAVRPLLDDQSGDPSAVTRDYLLDLQQSPAPLLNVWGGKITTFRKLSEEAADMLAPLLGMRGGAWTSGSVLPGGDLERLTGRRSRPDADFEAFVRQLQSRFSWLPNTMARRLARAYGSRTLDLLGKAGSLADLGAEVAPQLHEAELDYLCRVEWARCAEDVLWRRSKLGLHYTPAQRAAVEAWFSARALPQAA